MKQPILIENECPYKVGNTINLHLDESYNHKTIEAKITHLFEPFTLSCVMVATLDSPELGLTGHRVLKVFDRRFATQLRKDHLEPDDWDTNMEQEYHELILNGGAEKLIGRLKENKKLYDEEAQDWDDAQCEAHLQYLAQKWHDVETEVYDIAKDIQGKHVPRLDARFTISTSSSQEAAIKQYADCPGLLLQYIDGFILTEVAQNAPREAWQSICEEAIRLLNLFGKRGVLNTDIKTRNFIVQKDTHTVFMIDFALCNFRRECQDNLEWRRWQSFEDEEGAIGRVMESRLEGGFVYHRTPYHDQLDDDFRSENAPYGIP